MDLMESRISMLTPRGNPQGKILPQYLVTLAATLCVFSVGSCLAWTAPALPMLALNSSSLNLAPEEGSWVASLLPIGALVGSLPAGSVADSFGRKRTILSIGVPLLVSWSLILSARSVYMLYAARFLAGLATGAAGAIVPIYLSEIAEPRIRGTLCSFFQLSLVFGVLYAYVMGAFCSFKTLAAVCLVVPVLFLVTFFRAPETPVYLLNKGLKQEAEDSLIKLRGIEYDYLIELSAQQTQLDKRPKGGSGLGAGLRRKETKRGLLICLGLMAFQQLVGINVVVFYTEKIFIEAGSSLEPRLATIAVGAAQVLASVVATALVDRAGRKALLLVSGVVMSLCLGTLGWFFYLKQRGGEVEALGAVPVTAVVAYISAFSVGFGPVPWLLVGELFSDEIRGPASGLSVATNWAMAFLTTKCFQDLASWIGMGPTFWLFTAVCLLATLFIAVLVVETKGKSLQEIQDELRGYSDSNNNRRKR